MASTVPRVECRQALTVEAGDQMGHRVTALAADGLGCLLVVGTIGDGDEHDSARRERLTRRAIGSGESTPDVPHRSASEADPSGGGTRQLLGIGV